MLLAMHGLEAALGAAAPRREQAWLGEVRRALGVPAKRGREEARNAAQPDSLLSDIARTQPCATGHARCGSTTASSRMGSRRWGTS
jgi:hypothetical protein